MDLAEKDFPRFEDIVKANDLDEDWFQPLPARSSGGKKRSWAYDVSRCMKRGHPQFDMGQTDGKNFQCLVVMPKTGKICGQLFKCKPGRTTGSFIISQALGHIKAQIHLGTRAHTKANATAHQKASTAVQQSLTNSFAAGTKTTSKSQTEQLYTQAQWYIYSTHVVSKQMFRECPFKGMLKAQNSEAHIINPTQLIHYVRCEHDLFKKFVSEALMMAAMETKGNRHAQATHDGVTLKDKRKYQALGLNFSLMYRNWTIALGFVKCADGTSKGVASLYLKTFKGVSRMWLVHLFPTKQQQA